MKKQRLFMIAMIACFLIMLGIIFIFILRDFFVSLFSNLYLYYYRYSANGYDYSYLSGLMNNITSFIATCFNIINLFIFMPLCAIMILLLIASTYLIEQEKIVSKIVGLIMAAFVSIPINLVFAGYLFIKFGLSLYNLIIGVSQILPAIQNGLMILAILALSTLMLLPFGFYVAAFVFTFVKNRNPDLAETNQINNQ